jgi:Gpi18-like mannosyltransferase
MDNSLSRNRIEILLLFALYLVILPQSYMDYDMGFWREWALYLHHNGLGNAYNGTINYLPVYVYGLYFYDLLQGTDTNIIHHINSIKVLFVIFDFLPVFVLCCFRQKIFSFKIPYLYLLLNVAYVFTSMVWGQIDSIYTNLAFLAILTGLLYPVAGSLLFLLALNTKPQAIEFIPIMSLVLLYSVRSASTVIKILLSAVAVQFVILLPFIHSGGVGRLLHISGHVVGLYQQLSLCAFNFWYLAARGNPFFIKDTSTYILLSYRTIGLLLFTASAAAVLIPLMKRIWLARKNTLGIDSQTYSQLLLGTGLLCLFFFYFNTEMHERYAHPVIIFFFFYGVVSKNYKLYVLVSISYFLSLDKSFSFPDGYLPIVHYKIIYASKIIALWYTVTIIYGSYVYYRLCRGKLIST